MKFVIEMELLKETKHTYRYASKPGNEVRTIYIEKLAFNGMRPPETITLTITTP